MTRPSIGMHVEIDTGDGPDMTVIGFRGRDVICAWLTNAQTLESCKFAPEELKLWEPR